MDEISFKTLKQRMSRWRRYVNFITNEFGLDLGKKPLEDKNGATHDPTLIHKWKVEAKEKAVTLYEKFISKCKEEGGLAGASKGKGKSQDLSFNFLLQCVVNMNNLRKIRKETHAK